MGGEAGGGQSGGLCQELSNDFLDRLLSKHLSIFTKKRQWLQVGSETYTSKRTELMRTSSTNCRQYGRRSQDSRSRRTCESQGRRNYMETEQNFGGLTGYKAVLCMH